MTGPRCESCISPIEIPTTKPKRDAPSGTRAPRPAESKRRPTTRAPSRTPPPVEIATPATAPAVPAAAYRAGTAASSTTFWNARRKLQSHVSPSPSAAWAASSASNSSTSAASTSSVSSDGKRLGSTRTSRVASATTGVSWSTRRRAARTVSARASATRSAGLAGGTNRANVTGAPSDRMLAPIATTASATAIRPKSSGPSRRGRRATIASCVASSVPFPWSAIEAADALRGTRRRRRPLTAPTGPA